MSGTLVAAPIDTATPLSGTGLLESGDQLAAAIRSGDWVEGSLAGVGVALDTAATVVDPVGSLIAMGFGWLIDHLEPLKGWFNDLTGDAGEVAAFGQTWANIQGELQTAGADLAHFLTDLEDLDGEAVDAYRRFQADTAEHISAAASWAGAMSTGLQIASTIVQVVHDLVRDVLSQLVGSIISWAAEAVLSLGLATPVIVGQVATKVAAWSAKIGSAVVEVLSSCRALARLLGELAGLMHRSGSLYDSLLRGWAPPTPARLDPAGALAALVPVRRPPEAVVPPRKWVDDATPEQIKHDLEVLRYYTGDGHEEMNAALRGEIDMTPELREKIDAAVRALDRLPDFTGTVLRGEDAPPGATYLEAYQPGEIVTNPAFTSSDLWNPFPGNVQYEIQSLHGKHVEHISMHGGDEAEVLFRPGTRFYVENRTEVGDEVLILLREME